MSLVTPRLFSQTPYIRRISQLSASQLSAIDRYLQQQLEQNANNLKKTHYFHQRFENIYLKTIQNTDLERLLEESLGYCAELLGMCTDELKIGYWFNLMQPGHVTTLHRHDDFDELISGVIYLSVPENSGDLVLETPEQSIVIKPVSGNFIFFDPATPHRVTENRSEHYRLSIGMNIGPAGNTTL
ncbi:MAG: 2OG-Fe(II) oxygenase [Gammaproteobacteria bacterium]|nr:2OG-Fe(II) oxygenase [Gammaproteobacteria bacterium]MBL6999956.1 2OG-Fe(II) oxygenase [Gammaproteobacteria bacterium]